MKILGIDPGFERLGVAILEKNPGDKNEKVIYSECFKTSAKLEFADRLKLIGEEVNTVIKKYALIKAYCIKLTRLFVNFLLAKVF